MPCECWASPTRPPERQSWRVPVATARTSAPLTWFTWKSRPASAGPRATPQAQAAARVPRTPAARACAAGGATTPPCTSPACPATARCAGAATWSVKHVWERRRCIPAKPHDKWCDVTKKWRQNKTKERLTRTPTEVSAQDFAAWASLCRAPGVFLGRNICNVRSQLFICHRQVDLEGPTEIQDGFETILHFFTPMHWYTTFLGQREPRFCNRYWTGLDPNSSTMSNALSAEKLWYWHWCILIVLNLSTWLFIVCFCKWVLPLRLKWPHKGTRLSVCFFCLLLLFLPD